MTIFHNQALENQHILITGATGGIGHETAIAAIEAGAKVTVTGRNEDKLAKLKESVQSPNNLHVFPADLTKEEDRQHL